MTKHYSYLVFWSLFAAAVSGAMVSLLAVGNSGMSSLQLWMSDVQSCIEVSGTLTCGIHHIVGSRTFAIFAVGVLVGIFCALPAALRCLAQRQVGFTSSFLLSVCMGAIVYFGAKSFGLIADFLFADLFVLCIVGACTGLWPLLAFRKDTNSASR